jgi:RNA polymerase sigma-70 factor (ECF subfamily)
VEARLRELFARATAEGRIRAARFDAVAAEMYRAYHRDVEAIAVKRRVPDSRVDDVCSSTWTAVPKALETFKGEGSFYSWLAGIVTKKVLDEFRSAKRRKYDRLSGAIVQLCAQAPAPSHERPSRQAAQAEIDRRVRHALAQLEPEERELLLLHYEEGESAADIARAQGLKPNTVAQRLVRARDRMMKLYLAAARVG